MPSGLTNVYGAARKTNRDLVMSGAAGYADHDITPFSRVVVVDNKASRREGGYWGAPPRRANCFPAALAAAICWARTASTCIGLPYADAAEVGPREGSTDIGWGEGGTRAIDELEAPPDNDTGCEAGVG